MAMAQKYLFIAISFYRNIVRENVSCELGLRQGRATTVFSSAGHIGLLFVFRGSNSYQISFLKAKNGVFAGRMWTAGRMLV